MWMTFRATTAIVGWRPGINDPTAVGFTITLAYATAATLCWRRYRHARTLQQRAATASEVQDQGLLRKVWSATAVLLLLLAANKQLNVQSGLLQTIRRKSQEQGWYQDRRSYQVWLIGATLLLGVLLTIALIWLLRRVLRRAILVLLGAASLGVFVTVRSMSFHDVDRLLAFDAGVSLNSALELSGILIVVLSTFVPQSERNDAADDQRGPSTGDVTEAGVTRPTAGLGTSERR